MAAANPSATLADPPPKPPPDKPPPPNPRSEKTLIQSSSATAADLGQTSQSSSPASDGPSTVTGNFVLQHASMASKSHIQSLPSEAAVDINLGQTCKSSSPATTIQFPANGVHAPTSGNNGNKLIASKPSFAEVTKNGSSSNKRKSEPSLHIFGQPPPLPGAKIISENGVDILVFDEEATDLLTASLKWALVGKFSHNLPYIHTVSKFLSTLDLRGEFELKWLSHRQLLIVLTEEIDYALIWSKGLWVIDGCPMRALKWTPTFNARTECPHAPVWASLPGLPVHLFEKRALHMIASQLGTPLMVDSPTATRKRATLARICVEINLLDPIKDVLNLRINGLSIQQPIMYENMPRYCSHCSHIGHTINHCFVKNMDLKVVYDERRIEKKRKIKDKNKVEWVVKDKFNHHSMSNSNVTSLGNEGKVANNLTLDGGSKVIEATAKVVHAVHAAVSEQGTVVGVADVAHADSMHLKGSSNSEYYGGEVTINNNSVKNACISNFAEGDVALSRKFRHSVNAAAVDVPMHFSNIVHVKSHLNGPQLVLHGDAISDAVGEPANVLGLHDSGKDTCIANTDENVIGGMNMQIGPSAVGPSGTDDVDIQGLIGVLPVKDITPPHPKSGCVVSAVQNNFNVSEKEDGLIIDFEEGEVPMHEGKFERYNNSVLAAVSEQGTVVVVADVAHPDSMHLKDLIKFDALGGACSSNKYSGGDVAFNFESPKDACIYSTDEGDVARRSSHSAHVAAIDVPMRGPGASSNSVLHATVPDEVAMADSDAPIDGQSANGPSVAEHFNPPQPTLHDVNGSGRAVSNATSTDYSEQEDCLDDVARLFDQNVDCIRMTIDDDDVTMLPPETKILIASVEDDAFMTISGVHAQNDLAKVDGPYSVGPLTLPMKPIFQFNPANVELPLNKSDTNLVNAGINSATLINKVLHEDIFRVTGVMPADFPKQLVLSPFHTSNVFTKPLKTIYPDGKVLVNNANYPDVSTRRDCFDHDSPRSEYSNDESSEYNEMDDIDDDFGDRPFHRTCSYPNLNDYKKAEYGGRITRSMARNGKAKV